MLFIFLAISIGVVQLTFGINYSLRCIGKNRFLRDYLLHLQLLLLDYSWLHHPPMPLHLAMEAGNLKIMAIL